MSCPGYGIAKQNFSVYAPAVGLQNKIFLSMPRVSPIAPRQIPGATAENFLSLLKILPNSVILDTEKVCKKVRLP